MSEAAVKLPPADSELAGLVELMCEGAITPGERDRLEGLLAGNRDARLFYLAYLDMHARMIWHTRGRRRRPSAVAPPVSADHHVATLTSFSSSTLISYTIVVLLVGVALLGAWAWNAPRGGETPVVAQQSGQPIAQGGQTASEPEIAPVGHVTRAEHCRWGEAKTDAKDRDPVCVGRKYNLLCGVMGVSYDAGIDVTLQGPAEYAVESKASGLLSHGKLTARREKWTGARGQGSGFRGQGSDSSDARSEVPFVLHTPSAVITDRGAEFEVDVDRAGASRLHVLRGRIELKLAGSDGKFVFLPGEGESVCVETRGGVSVARFTVPAAGPSGSSPLIAEQPPVESKQTAGAPTPAGTPELRTTVQPDAVIPVVFPITAQAEGGDPIWIVKHTFRFALNFNLKGIVMEKPALRGRFLTRDHVLAIRLNDTSEPLPARADGDQVKQYWEFLIQDGLHRGKNTLEIDVETVYHSDPSAIIAQKSKKMPVSLAVEGLCRLPTESDGAASNAASAGPPPSDGTQGTK